MIKKVEIGRDTVVDKILEARRALIALKKEPKIIIVSKPLATQLLIEMDYEYNDREFLSPDKYDPINLVGARLFGMLCYVEDSYDLSIEVRAVL